MRFKLVEFAYSKRKIEDSLVDHTGEIINHIIKLCLYPHSEYENHWKKEVYSFIHDIKKLNYNNKFPSAKFIYDKTFGVWSDTISERIDSIEEEYGKSLEYNVYSKCYTVCDAYFRWLASQLSTKGIVSISKVCEELDKLI